MAVAIDATGTAQGTPNSTKVSSWNYTGITVGSGANRALIFVCTIGDDVSAQPTGITATWDSGGSNQAMTLLTSMADPSSGANNNQIFIYGLRNPTAGNKTLTVSWTGARWFAGNAISFTGVDQTSDAVAFPHTNTGSLTTPGALSIAVTSATGNWAVAGYATLDGVGTTNHLVWLDSTTAGGGLWTNDNLFAQNSTGASTVTFTDSFSSSFGGYGAAAVDIAAAGGGGVTGTLGATEAADVAALVGTADAALGAPMLSTLRAFWGKRPWLLNRIIPGTVASIPQIPANPIFVPGHSLLTNMLACYLPGVYGGVPVQNAGPTLGNGAGGAGTVSSTVEGPSLTSNTIGAAKGLTGTAPSGFKTWTNCTFYWRGLVIGNGDAFCPIGGISCTNTDVSPYYMLGISANGSPNSYSQTLAFYGDGTSFKTAGPFDATPYYGQVVDFVAVATVGGSVTLYANGVSIGTNTLTTNSTSDATAQITINQGIDATSRSPNASVNMACFWDRALSSTEVANLYSNPYAFLQSGTSAALAATEAADVAAFTGTTAWNAVLAATEAADVAAFTGTISAAAITGTLAATEAADVAAFTGTIAWNATLAATEAADVAAINGLLGASGTLAATEAADTAALTGTIAWTATLAATETADVAAFTSNVAWTAVLAATETKDTAAFTGGIVGTGILAATEAADTASFTGGIVGTGILAATEAADVAAFSGSLAGAGVAGSLAATETADSAAINATITGTIGTIAATEAADTAAINASVSWNATLAATELKDSAALTGTTAWNATLAATESLDIAAISASVRWNAVLAATETPDSAAIFAFLPVTGTLAATEASDIAAITGTVPLSGLTGVLAATERADTMQILAQTRGDAPGVLTFGRRVTINRW